MNSKQIQMKVIFIYESHITKIIMCNPNDKIINIFLKFCNFISNNLNSILFLYGGRDISKLDMTLYNLANNYDKERKELSILAYLKDKDEINTFRKNNNNISYKIIFSFEAEKIIKLQCQKEDKMKDLCIKFAKSISMKIDSLYFIYGNKTFDMNLNFDQLANSYDKKCKGMTIIVYKINNIEKIYSIGQIYRSIHQ